MIHRTIRPHSHTIWFCKGPLSVFDGYEQAVVVFFKDFNGPVEQMAHDAVIQAANAHPSKLFMEVSHSVAEQQAAQQSNMGLLPEVVNNPVYASGGNDSLIVDSVNDQQELVDFLMDEASKNISVFSPSEGSSW